MNKFIAYCGLDCEKCEARIATVNNDIQLREKVAQLWTKLNGVKITADMMARKRLIARHSVRFVNARYHEVWKPAETALIWKHVKSFRRS